MVFLDNQIKHAPNMNVITIFQSSPFSFNNNLLLKLNITYQKFLTLSPSNIASPI
jgi:hypothetical protein